MKNQRDNGRLYMILFSFGENLLLLSCRCKCGFYVTSIHSGIELVKARFHILWEYIHFKFALILKCSLSGISFGIPDVYITLSFLVPSIPRRLPETQCWFPASYLLLSGGPTSLLLYTTQIPWEEQRERQSDSLVYFPSLTCLYSLGPGLGLVSSLMLSNGYFCVCCIQFF